MFPFIDVARKVELFSTLVPTRLSECNASMKTEAQQDSRDLNTGDIVCQASSSTHRDMTEGG